MTWSGVRVLVTGADGFIGSHLTEALVEAGATVRAFCLYNSHGSLGWLEESAPAVREALDIRLGDIRDARFVEEACAGVDIVFHLAALISVPYSYVAPASFVDTNVKGTLNVLEAVHANECRRLVHTSTSEVYGTPTTIPIVESHPLRAQSPYSASKIAADKLCESYSCTFDTPVVTVRPFNTYGPRQSERAVVATILSQLLAGHKVVRLGNLAPRRDLTYLTDTVAGFLAAGLAEGVEGEVIQLGTGTAHSIRDVFETAKRVCGASAAIAEDTQRVRMARSEVDHLECDPAVALRRLGWRASIPLEEGLRRTAEWMQGHASRLRPDVYAI